MLNIPRQSYNTGARNTAKLYPDEDRRIGVALRYLKITLGAQIDDGANATIYVPQDCHLLNFIVVGHPIDHVTLALHHGNLRLTAEGGDVAADTVIELMMIEKS